MKKLNFKLILFFLAAVVLLVFLHLLGALRPVERIFYFAFNPVGVKLQSWSNGFNHLYNEKLNQGDLITQVSGLKEQIERLTVENAGLKKLEEENSKLRQHLNFLESGGQKKYLLANVVSREVFSGSMENHGYFIIDKGKDDGIISSLVVLNEQGAVVGKITEVEEKSSRFLLVTNSACKFAATLQNDNRTVGVTSGNLGLTVNIDYIPQVETVNIGDTAVTSGLEPFIPRGLVIGKVAKVEKGSNAIWQSVNIQPLADFDDLTIVSILIP
jgi:rod shape-determining protein MreC